MNCVDTIFIDPWGEIDRAIASEDWIKGFTSACTSLEHFGSIKLSNKLKPKAIKKMGARAIICNLLKFNIIDNDTYLELKKINKMRNDLDHPLRKGIGYIHTLDPTETRKLLLNAKKLIQQIAATKI